MELTQVFILLTLDCSFILYNLEGSVYTNIVGSMPKFLGFLFHTFGPYLLKTPFQGY